MSKKTICTTLLLALATMLNAGGHKVLFIGDSITDGAWGNSGVWNATSEQRNQTDMNHIYGHGYMMITAAHYEALYPEENWKFWNRGISGNTLDDLAGRWKKDVLALRPDVVSILIGTNDVQRALDEGRTIDPAEWGDQLRTLLDEVMQQNPNVHFVLCTPFVAKAGRIGASEDYGKRCEMIASLTEVIKRICEVYPATLVPFGTLVEETIASTPDLPVTYWIWDGIHPTPAMHYRMAALWQELITF